MSLLPPIVDIGIGAAVGFTASWIGIRRHLPTRVVHDQIKPFCGCQHHLSYHHPDTGQCKATDRVSGVHVKCTCQQYVGPQPAHEFFSSEIDWNTTRMRTDPPPHP